jgi:Txe/YoeB family toxin of toxin-antitoxin system
VNYRVFIKNSAKADLKKLKRSYLRDRFDEIIAVLKDNPYAPTDSLEKLLPYSDGLYSRRLNHQHRVVYAIDEQAKAVYIFSAWTHYHG